MSQYDPQCEAKGIPRHLHCLNRSAEPFFETTELLYRRFSSEVIDDLTAAISFERMSVNRQKFCHSPDDVLWNDKEGGQYAGCGVLAIPVAALDIRISHAHEDYSFTLRPEHCPEPCNYPHSEVIATKVLPDGTEVPLREIRPKSVKLAIRKALENSISVVRIEENNDLAPAL
jgi:hypothetical protein